MKSHSHKTNIAATRPSKPMVLTLPGPTDDTALPDAFAVSEAVPDAPELVPVAWDPEAVVVADTLAIFSKPAVMVTGIGVIPKTLGSVALN